MLKGGEKSMESIKNLISIFLIIISLAKELIKMIEIPGYGPEKKQAILDIFALLFDIIEANMFKLPFGKEQLLNVVSGLIDILVGFFNRAGVFAHGLSQKLSNCGEN